MLQQLTVKNFALIRDLQFRPGDGLNVITGETGAGKSILLGALGLVLGNRAETSALLNQNEKCIVEAIFDISKSNLSDLFSSNDLDYDPICTIRREINPQGKSRAFVNDTPVQLGTLKIIGSNLIQIHTQNTGLLVTNAQEQLQFIDDYAVPAELRSKYQITWQNWKAASSRLDELKETQAVAEKERDFLEFQFNELKEFQINPGELARLTDLISKYSHAGEIQEACSNANTLLTGDEQSVYSGLSALKSVIKPLKHLPNGEEYIQRIESLLIEVKDISNELEKEGNATEADPEKLEELNARLSRLQLLMRKHQADDSDDLIETEKKLEEQLQKGLQLDDRIGETEKEVNELAAKTAQLAVEIHEFRKKSAESLLNSAVELLKLLGMPHAQLKTEWIGPSEIPGRNGFYLPEFLFSANPGAPMQKLEKAASGGELSRINFSFKTLLGGKQQLPTLIYDEADTGISGEVANQMGKMMRKLGEKHQVIAITHLPQVAAGGHHHYYIYKSVNEDSTESRLVLMRPDERIQHLAEMLGGSNPGESALETARKLIQNNESLS